MIEDRGRWVSITAAQNAAETEDPELAAAARDVLSFLTAPASVQEKAKHLLDHEAGDQSAAVNPAEAGLPFVPRSIRAFMLWQQHVERSSRMLVRQFFPPIVRIVVDTFERTTGRTFPKLAPNQRFWDAPTFYLANHTMLLTDGQPMWWPSHTEYLDFELELACVLRSPLIDASPEEAAAAVGGWFILNDWSARDVQADDARHNIFGPVIKSKTFANSIGCDVVTPDEFGDWKQATGRVRVDDEVWCEGTTANPAHDIGEMLAYASKGERLDAGDVISTGTMPGCCGLEIPRWIKPGQTIELEIDRIGTLTNPVSAHAVPTTAAPTYGYGDAQRDLTPTSLNG